MAKVHLVLKKKGNKYFFSNPKRETENELFDCKAEGIAILSEYLINEVISEADAAELLHAVLNVWDIPYGKPEPLNQFDSDVLAIKLIDDFKDRLALATAINEIPDLPVFRICPGCGEHGRILTKKSMSCELHSKEMAFDALDEFIGSGSITRREEKKLRTQIEESSLPKKDVNENSHLN